MLVGGNLVGMSCEREAAMGYIKVLRSETQTRFASKWKKSGGGLGEVTRRGGEEEETNFCVNLPGILLRESVTLGPLLLDQCRERHCVGRDPSWL